MSETVEENILSFTGLLDLMEREGYVYRLVFTNQEGRDQSCYAMRKNGDGTTVTSEEPAPRLALKDLLEKCRVRWPKPGPFDGKSLEMLVGECVERKWHPVIKDETAEPHKGYWLAHWNDRLSCHGRGVSLYAALKEAMTNRANADTPQSHIRTTQRTSQFDVRYPNV